MLLEKTVMTLEEFEERELPILWSIIDFSSNIPVSIYTDTTVVKTSETCYRGALHSTSSRLIGEEYLLNAKKSSIDISLPIGTYSYSALAPRASLSFKHFLEGEVHQKNKSVKLPKFSKVTAPIGSVIRSRRSIRDFKGRKLSLKELSTLLYYGNGVSGDFDHNPHKGFDSTVSLGEDYISNVRTAPSGGGLYPIYLYIIALSVDKLEKGIYKYMPLTHSLEIVKTFDDKDLEYYFNISNFGLNIDMNKVSAAIYYVYNIYENSRKYGDMGLQFAFIEVGEIAQNIHLTATAESIISCDIGGFDKGLSESFLGLDGLTNHLLHITLVGR